MNLQSADGDQNPLDQTSVPSFGYFRSLIFVHLLQPYADSPPMERNKQIGNTFKEYFNWACSHVRKNRSWLGIINNEGSLRTFWELRLFALGMLNCA